MNRAWRTIALGLLCGLGWGATARLWMRFVATDPAFTWSGTIFVLAAPSLAGAAMGIAAVSGRSWAKGVGVVALVPLGMGAGALMLPTILFGTLAVRRRTLPMWARVVYAAVAFAPAPLVVSSVWDGDRSIARAAVGVAWYAGLCAWMMAIAAVSIGSSPSATDPKTAGSGRADAFSDR